VEYKNFVTNFRNLHIKLQALGNYANDNDLALQNDRRIHPINMDNPQMAYLHWDGHPAQRWLQIDVNNQAHLGVMPKDFRMTRGKKYQAFPLEAFWKHIHQQEQS
jgi:hypothetical protein